MGIFPSVLENPHIYGNAFMLRHLKHIFLHIKNGKEKKKSFILFPALLKLQTEQQKEIKLLGQFQWMPH